MRKGGSDSEMGLGEMTRMGGRFASQSEQLDENPGVLGRRESEPIGKAELDSRFMRRTSPREEPYLTLEMEIPPHVNHTSDK
jgi:hypothetical protein